MPITVVISNSDGIIHGTDNGKRTGCGIRYNYGDNLRKYKQGEVLTDLIIAMKTLNCEKCRRTLSTKMIKEDRKAENKREKEEKKRIAEAIKRGELDADGNPIVNPEVAEETQSVETAVQPVQEPIATAEVQEPMQPIESEQAQPINDTQTEKTYQPIDDDISQYIYEKPQEEQIETPKEVTPTIDDDLTQFMVNPEEIKASEPEPIKPKKPLTDINDILADLDALMSNMNVKAPEPVNAKSNTVQPVEELPTIDEVAPIEETPIVEELPTIDEVAPIEETPIVEELPTIDEVAPIEETPIVE
ncbi:MAG: hypothetical protein LIO71_04820, partial [Ruminococcus sp.]|nr:hypothetical protein [Ruminococcus sp.]